MRYKRPGYGRLTYPELEFHHSQTMRLWFWYVLVSYLVGGSALMLLFWAWPSSASWNIPSWMAGIIAYTFMTWLVGSHFVARRMAWRTMHERFSGTDIVRLRRQEGWWAGDFRSGDDVWYKGRPAYVHTFHSSENPPIPSGHVPITFADALQLGYVSVPADDLERRSEGGVA